MDSAPELPAKADTVLTHSVPLWNLPCHQPKCLEAILYLEMSGIAYKRKITRYNINVFSDTQLPFLRHGLQTTRSVIDFYENAQIAKEHNSLNSQLQLTQHADVTALQSLIRDRLSLVFVCKMCQQNINFLEIDCADAPIVRQRGELA